MPRAPLHPGFHGKKTVACRLETVVQLETTTQRLVSHLGEDVTATHTLQIADQRIWFLRKEVKTLSPNIP